MNLTLIGLIFNFVGSFAILIETISGGTVRYKIYHSVIRVVHQFTGDYTPPVKLKLNTKEWRVLIWVILICAGFLLQILDFII